MTTLWATLSDGVRFFRFEAVAPYVLLDGVKVPNPERNVRYAGEGPHRDGADLAGWNLKNRVLSVPFRIEASDIGDLKARQQRIGQMLEVGRRSSKQERGRGLTFTWQESDAAEPAIADVLSGELIPTDLDAGLDNTGFRERSNRHRAPFLLVLTCRPAFRAPQVVLAAQTITNKPSGIQYRFLYQATLGTLNLATRVDGPLWATTRTGSTAITPANTDYVVLSDPDGTYDHLDFGVATPLAYSVAPVWNLLYSKGAGATGTLTNVTLFNTLYPDGIDLTTAGGLVAAFVTAGPVRLTWAIPGDWATNTINSTAGYALYLQQSATLGTITTQPVLQYGPFRNGRGSLIVPASAVPGDLPARCEIRATNTGGVALRRIRAALLPDLQGSLSTPHVRHQAEFATGSNAGALDTTTFAANTIRGDGIIKVGAPVTDYQIAFDGTGGYLDFGTTNLGTRSDNWVDEFYFTPDPDPNEPTGTISANAQALWGSWDSAGNRRKYLVFLEERQVCLMLSRNGTDIVRYDAPYKKLSKLSWADNGSKKLLSSHVEIQANVTYLVRVSRAGNKIALNVASQTTGKLPGDVFPTVQAVTSSGSLDKLDSLGSAALYTATPAAFRLGDQVSFLHDDTRTGKIVVPFKGRIEQLYTAKAADTGTSWPTGGARTGQRGGNDAANNQIGLYHFNDAPGRLVNSQTTGTPTATPTRSGPGTSDVVGLFSAVGYTDIQATLKLSWSLLDAYRGDYRVLAIVRAASSTQHTVAASQAGFQLANTTRSVAVTGVWQVLDLGIARLPWQPVSGGYSSLGPTVDSAEDLAFVVGHSATAASDFYLDEFVLIPLDHWYSLFDSGTTSARSIAVGESVVWSSLTDPPQVGQLDSSGRVRPNPDRNGDQLGAEPFLVPGVDNYLIFNTDRFTSLECAAADTLSVVITVEAQTLSVAALS